MWCCKNNLARFLGPSFREASKEHSRLVQASSLHTWEVLFCLETFKRTVSRGNAGAGNPMGDRNCLKNLVMSGWDAEAAFQSQEKSCHWQERGEWPSSPRKAPWAPGQTFGSSWASRNLREDSSLLIITGTWLSAELKLWWPTVSLKRRNKFGQRKRVAERDTHVYLQCDSGALCHDPQALSLG